MKRIKRIAQEMAINSPRTDEKEFGMLIIKAVKDESQLIQSLLNGNLKTWHKWENILIKEGIID